MAQYYFTSKLGSHLSVQELEQASAVLSNGYTRWQNHPKNTNPLKTDTSPEVYARMMVRGNREVVLYYEQDTLCAVYVHSLAPHYDQFPLRKLSYVAISPLERGYENLKKAIQRYATFVAEQGEDAIITSDLEQGTLNSLLEAAGFCEVVDRNETYYLLSQLLFRKVFSASKISNDFVVDEIIVCNNKAIRRDKKLYRLQTTAMDFYEVYRRQQCNRIKRSIPTENRELLYEALQQSDEGLYFISDFTGVITDTAHYDKFDPKLAIIGEDGEAMLPQLIDKERNIVYLLPKSEQELGEIATRCPLRAGFFDFLCYCYSILGSFFVASGVTRIEAQAALGKNLHTHIPLSYADMVEAIFALDVEVFPLDTKVFDDGLERTAFRYSGPYIDFSQGRFGLKKDCMINAILKLKRNSSAPVIYFGNHVHEGLEIRQLYEESKQLKIPVLIMDFGEEITSWTGENIIRAYTDHNPYFSVLNIRDFYQVPVMLEYLGLKTCRGIDLSIA